MLLRRLLAALCPLLLCILVCAAYRWLDSLVAASFLTYLVKGLLLGAVLALIPPIAGVKTRLTGLSVWLLVGAGLMLITLAYQYLESAGIVHSALLLSLLTINGQTVLVESAVMGFMLTLCALCRGK